ncbi:MAG: HlyD family efflux transporter periplasmic adaptor subunit [Alphaproteobacteria bacterium]|jgi:HlyD family secretion protein|nr:efflux transporter periplasmic adaptor subunit [Rhodospirillaceae bacterium]MDP6404094.1 HlyD family efflux transporter periplasmic adaptor subunit [Alphaproteobacteria bacterium]MDP6621004.1 HlyD family efflux transporter periplasmic adaptor subunit [Alphaproteobacteria bacterium]
MGRTFKRVFYVIIVLGLAAAGLAYAFRPQAVPADFATVDRGKLMVTVDDTGRTRVRDVYRVSAPVAGRLLRIEARVGDAATAGETVLATIEPSDPSFLDRRSRSQAQAEVKAAEAALALAQAELKRVRAELTFARSELERARALVLRNNISKRAMDKAGRDVQTGQAAEQSAAATVRIRRYELEMARAMLIRPGQKRGKTGSQCCVEVRAPVSGRVLRLIQESEGVIAAGTPLLEIGDPGDLEIVVDLLSSDAVKVREGAAVMVEEWGGGTTLAGTVRRIEPYGFTKISALGIEEQRVNAIIDFAEPREKWRSLGHGYRVEVRIVVWQGENVLKLPLSALFRDGEDWAVFALVGGKARLRRLAIGRSNASEAQLRDGLAEGDRVVLHPSDRIVEGVELVSRPAG